MKPKTRILLVEDSDAQRKLIADGLRAMGYEVYEAWSLESARRLLPSVNPSILLLDLKLDAENGSDLLLEVARKRIGVIVLSVVDNPDTRVECLEAGALDYMTKPADMRELALRIRKLELLLSRDAGSTSEIELGCMKVNIVSRHIYANDGQFAPLSNAEFNLLMAFINAKGEILSREFLADQTKYRQQNPQSRSVDLLVSKLRRKLQMLGKRRLVSSVRNEGYRFWGDELEFPD